LTQRLCLPTRLSQPQTTGEAIVTVLVLAGAKVLLMAPRAHACPSDWLKDLVELSKHGAIIVDAKG
jgi:alkyl hydroperoxide reductase subunit AhpF